MDAFIIGQRRIPVESTLFWLRCPMKYPSLQLSTLPNELWAYYQLPKMQDFDALNKTLTSMNAKAQEEKLQAKKAQTGLEMKKLQENVGDKRNKRVRCAQKKSNSSSNAISIMITLFMLASMIKGATAVVNYRIEGCYPCTELMNREWRKDLPDNCTSTLNDCGKCLEGYEANKDDETCHLKAEISVKDRSFAIVPSGTSLTLNCHFKENVDCYWKRRGYVIEISNRYSYQSNNGVNTKDCSIKIFPFLDTLDYGLLECESKTDAFGSSTSTSAVIEVCSEKAITADESYSKVITEVQGMVIIHCYYNQFVDCVWRRRGYLVEIMGRYSYLNAKKVKGTKDCSIKITSFREIDSGLWQCQSVGDSSTPAISSTSVELLKVDVKYPAIALGPNTTNVLIGDKVNLTCQFDAEVQCIWQQNGTEVNNKTRYSFIANSSIHVKKDCSIEILNFKEEDVGNWTCTYKGAHTITTSGTAMLNIPPMHAPSDPEISVTNPAYRIRRFTEAVKDDETAVCVSRYGNPAAKLRWEMGIERFKSNQTIKRNGLLFDVEIKMNLSNHQFEEGVNILRCIATHPMFEDGGTKEVSIEIVIDAENHNVRMYAIIILSSFGAYLIMSSIIWFLYKKYRKFNKITGLSKISESDRLAETSINNNSFINESNEKLESEKLKTVKEDAETELLKRDDNDENENGTRKDIDDDDDESSDDEGRLNYLEGWTSTSSMTIEPAKFVPTMYRESSAISQLTSKDSGIFVSSFSVDMARHHFRGEDDENENATTVDGRKLHILEGISTTETITYRNVKKNESENSSSEEDNGEESKKMN